MYLRVIRMLPLPLLMLFGSGGVLARTLTVPQIPPGDPMLEPLQRGDVKLVHQIEGRVSANPIMRAMDEAQLSYDMPRLYSAARRCQKELLKAGSKDDLWTGWYCSYLVRSSALVRGDALSYLQEVRWIQDHLFKAMDSTSIKYTFHFGNQLDTAPLGKLIANTAPMSMSWKKGSTFIPFTNRFNGLGSEHIPSISITINGREVPAFIGTGPSVLRTPVTIVSASNHVSALASHLDLAHLLSHYFDVAISYEGGKYRNNNINLYVARNVTVGPLTLHHLAIGVMAANVVPPGVYLSNSMWRKFGQVVFSKSGVSLSRRPTDQCTQTVPLTFASSYFQLGSALFPVGVDGVAYRGSIALEDAHRAAVGPKVASAYATGSRGRSIVGHDPILDAITFRIGNAAISMQRIHAIDDWHAPFQVMIGRPILATHKVYLRLRGGRPSICLATYGRRPAERLPDAGATPSVGRVTSAAQGGE